MQKARRNAINSLRSANVLSIPSLSRNVPSGSLVNVDPQVLASESKRAKTPENLSIKDNQSHLAEAHSTSQNRTEQESDFLKLKYELERVRSQARSIEKENELLRGLLATEPTRPANTFRRAILMRLYPDEVVNPIGVHSGHDTIFVAIYGTLFNSKSLPLQKISTSFSDGRWQEEMKFILDSESRWIEGRVVLELKQQMFSTPEEPIIATASISLSRCLDWLQEGGEHSVQLEMERTSVALKDESTRTLLFVTVKVAAERMSADQASNGQRLIGKETNDQSFHSHETLIETKHEFHDEVATPLSANPICDAVAAALPGIPDESVSDDIVLANSSHLDSTQPAILNEEAAEDKLTEEEPHLSDMSSGIKKTAPNFETVAKRVGLMTRWKKNTLNKPASTVDESVKAASSTDDEANDVAQTINAVSSSSGGRRLELAPNSNRSISAEFVDSRAGRSSLTSMLYQRKAAGSKILLAPVRNESQIRAQSNILKSLDSELIAKSVEMLQNLDSSNRIESVPDIGTLTSEAIENNVHEIQESDSRDTGIDPNFVATIKGVSFANNRLLSIIKKNRGAKSHVSSDPIDATEKSDSSILTFEPMPLASMPIDDASKVPLEMNMNSATGCIPVLGTSLKVWFASARRLFKKIFARFRSRKRVATVQPFRDVLDVESEVDAMNLAEERRIKFQNSKAAARKLIEELETAEDEIAPSKAELDRDEDSIESKLIVAISVLKVATFELPNRAVKVTPVSAIVQVMKTLATGNSTAHQRLTTIQNYLQSKWIDCESMLQIMSWIKSPTEEVRFFECLAMRVIDKKGLARIAGRFIFTAGTKFVALKTVERLLSLSHKTVLARTQRKALMAADEDDLRAEDEDDEDLNF